jgi:TPR repeat protein
MWRFKPGRKQDKPVKILATVEISFRLSGRDFDEKAEQRRTRFNAIVWRLSKTANAKPTEQNVTAMQDLAIHKYPAASYALGLWQIKGDGVPKDAAAGLNNIQKAADENYGPAMYFIGKAQWSGDLMPKDPVKGLSLIRDAAVLGSREAQFMLGRIYEDGKDVEVDLARSKPYFRLCAASGAPECQFKLGQLLIGSPQRKESDWLQGIAWLELAQGHDFDPARKAAATEEAKLTPEQSQWVARLRGQLERKE